VTIVDQQELAWRLGISDRRVRQLESEGVVERLDGEPPRYDLDANARRYRLYVDHDIDTVCREVEEASGDVDDLFERMRMAGDVEKRRLIAKQDGHAIGRLDAAMALSNALAPEHARQMLGTFRNLIIGRACSDFLELCEVRLDTPAAEFQAECPQ
jgi:DNA-binding Lrp family transcriptional regulator